MPWRGCCRLWGSDGLSSLAPVTISVFSLIRGTGMTKMWLTCGITDMRKGIDGLAVLVQQVREQSPHSGALFAFRGKRGHLVKLLWNDGQCCPYFGPAFNAA